MRRFVIAITTGAVVLDETQIWPDGDGPAEPTAEDVHALIKGIGLSRVLDEWALDLDLTLSVGELESRTAG